MISMYKSPEKYTVNKSCRPLIIKLISGMLKHTLNFNMAVSEI